MSLGSGEYLIVSSCLRVPYNKNNLKSLISRLDTFDAKFGSATFLKVSPEKINFNLVWKGINELSMDSFSLNDLEGHFLSSLDIRFMEYIDGRLQVGFLDDNSYEISLIFNYTKLFEEEDDSEKILNTSKFVEEVGLVFFEEITPLYGSIGIERSVCGIKDIKKGECLFPTDKAYYSYYLYNKGLHLFESIIKSSSFFCEINNAGLYFRKTEVHDFRLLETEEEYVALSNLKEYV
jgi:hypothetical protein